MRSSAFFATTVTFDEHQIGTKLTLRKVVSFVTVTTLDTHGAEHEMARRGWTESLDRLVEFPAAF